MSEDLMRSRVERLEMLVSHLRKLAVGLAVVSVAACCLAFAGPEAGGDFHGVLSRFEAEKAAARERLAGKSPVTGETGGFVLGSSTEGAIAVPGSPLTVRDLGGELRGWFDWTEGTESVSLALVDPNSDATVYISLGDDHRASIMMLDKYGKVKMFKITRK